MEMKPESAPAPLMEIDELVTAAKENRPEVTEQLQMRLDSAFGAGIVKVSSFEFIPAEHVLVVKFTLGNGHTGEITYGT
ncbi:MAG TPA: hypothetical protein VMU12_00015 [Candidatus Paceibacterota bacterium]|nr:hypothetical protein [Candidatus Paceibacterota bacterium]